MPHESDVSIPLSDVISALSMALDLTEGQPMGHAIRSCMIGMRIGAELGLSAAEQSDLYYALLLKDSGCSSNSARLCQLLGADEIVAKREVKLEDWTKLSLSGAQYLWRNVLPKAPLTQRLKRMLQVALHQKENNAALIGARCERGADIARKIGLSETSAEAIRSLDEHWDGGGYPEGREKQKIPLLARIINVSQTLEVHAARDGAGAAIKIASERSGTWFDPELVAVVQNLRNESTLWESLKADNVRERVLRAEPGIAVPASAERLDSLCEAFAQVIDAKSPYTFRHSVGVAEASVNIAQHLGLAGSAITTIRRAALLHDIGKLSVSNAILEKPGKLDDAEWKIMRLHPVYTRLILRTISGFEHLAFIAGAHHERLDGKGYPDGLVAQQMPLTARIIAAADVYQALREERPYRIGLSHDVVMEMMDKDCPARLDKECVAALNGKHLTASKASPIQALAAKA